MPFIIRPTREYLLWIKKNTEKVAWKVENTVLQHRIAEGGFFADEMKTQMKKRVFFDRNWKQKLLRRHNRRLL